MAQLGLFTVTAPRLAQSPLWTGSGGAWLQLGWQEWPWSAGRAGQLQVGATILGAPSLSLP